MVNEPIKLQENLYLYSGDIVTISNSSPLLTDQIIKLRNIEDDKYLSKNFFSIKVLNFSTDFEKALTFTIKQNHNNGKISLQTNGKYLEPNGKKINLSSEEKWLTIAKQQ